MTMISLRLWLLLVCTAALVSTTIEAAASTYESIRALDQSGQNLQLQNAQAAANVQGRPIVAAVVSEMNDDSRTICIVSPILKPTPPKHAAVVPRDESLLSHAIARGSSQRILCTGLQADARWLLQTLREYAQSVHTRYDTTEQISVAQAVASLNRAVFWGKDNNNEGNGKAWQNPCAALLQPENSWGRPMGVLCLVLNAHDLTNLQIVEPSGVIQRSQHPLVCMGTKHQDVQLQLEALLLANKEESNNMSWTLQEFQAAVRQVFGNVFPTATAIQVEVLDQQGAIQQQMWSV